jgi:hypothetical protein
VALESAYRETLAFIDGEEIRSVGLCCISTGIFGYPIVAATNVALETVRKFLEVQENREKTERIVFVVFEKRDVAVYYDLIPKYFPVDGKSGTKGEDESEEEDERGRGLSGGASKLKSLSSSGPVLKTKPTKKPSPAPPKESIATKPAPASDPSPDLPTDPE